MTKRKAILIFGSIAIIIGVAHFIPISSATGVLNKENTICMGYASSRPYDYRVVFGGTSDYGKARSQLVSHDTEVPCGESVELRLYLL